MSNYDYFFSSCLGILLALCICGASFCAINPLAALLFIPVLVLEAVKYYFYCKDGVDSVYFLMEVILCTNCTMCGVLIAFMIAMPVCPLCIVPFFIWWIFSASEVVYTFVVYRKMMFGTDPREEAALEEVWQKRRHDYTVKAITGPLDDGVELEDFPETIQTRVHELAEEILGNGLG